MSEIKPLSVGAKCVTGAFLVSGAVHMIKPDVYEPLMPDWVPAHREVVLASGLAELACAAGLLMTRTRRLAGLASAALLAGVFPGNIKMAVDASRGDNVPFKVAAFARLPLQFPLIYSALKAGR